MIAIGTTTNRPQGGPLYIHTSYQCQTLLNKSVVIAVSYVELPNYEYEDPIKLIESKNTLFKMAQSHVNTYLIGRKKQQSFEADLTHKGSIFLTR